MELHSFDNNSSPIPGIMMPGMQGMSEMEKVLHGMHEEHEEPEEPEVYQHHDIEPCSPIPRPSYEEQVMQYHCPNPLPAPTPAKEVYLVKQGDSVYQIAKRYGTTMQAIIRANNLNNPNLIFPGQFLLIPRA